MNRTGNGAALCEDPHDFLVMQNLYDAAVRQLTLKFKEGTTLFLVAWVIFALVL